MLTRKCLELQDELWTSGWNNLTCEATVVYLETLVGKLRKLVREDLFHRHAVRSLAAVSKRYDETVLQNVVESASKDYGFRTWEWDEYSNSRSRRRVFSLDSISWQVEDNMTEQLMDRKG